MMKSMLGLLAGVWADAGKFIADELIAASAVEISNPFIRLLIFMIPYPSLRVFIGLVSILL
jgi:hypothetical protein